LKKIQLSTNESDRDERLDRFIARAGGIARGEARRALERGGVWLDGKRVKAASRALRPGQQVLVVLEEAGRKEPVIEALGPGRILFEDESLIAVDKPPFVAAQSTLGSDRGNLLALVEAHLGRSAGLVHRLDFETSGVTVFGKTRDATRALAAAFREGTAHKRYLALAVGPLDDQGVVDVALASDPRRKGRFVARPDGPVTALTRYRVLGRRGTIALVELLPETGRTHQIRVHLRHLGAPIAGDELYEGPTEIEGPDGMVAVPRVLLHARSLELPHPLTGQPLRIAAPLPEDLAALAALTSAPPDAL